MGTRDQHRTKGNESGGEFSTTSTARGGHDQLEIEAMQTMRQYFDIRFNFRELFNPQTGFSLRTGILGKDSDTGKTIDTGVDPFMRAMPALIDVGIMGSCVHGRKGLCRHAGVECYQDGLNVRQANMSLDAFKRIIDQVKGRTFQCALGGRGDPNKHEHFEDILRYSHAQGVVPNFTTSGLYLTDREARVAARYAGAAAVSFYRHEHTFRAMEKLISHGVKTNIHYVLSSSSIEEASDRLKNKGFPQGINAVVFLLHKPVGLGSRKNVLSSRDERVHDFFKCATGTTYPFKVGFDSCCVPGLLNHGAPMDRRVIEPCEGARFSCYIGPDMKMTPCSFDQPMTWAVDLRRNTVQSAWDSPSFDGFRAILRDSCPECSERGDCMGGCPLMPEITLCPNKPMNNKEMP